MPDVATRMRSPLFGLAPGGVCRAAAVTSARGALLPPRFTLTAHGLALVGGGLFSVALSLGSPPAAVNCHLVSMEPGLSSTTQLYGP